MNPVGEGKTNMLVPGFDRSIRVDFRGAKTSSDSGILLLRELDHRFGITDAIAGALEDPRSEAHTKHTYTDLLRQRIFQIASGYEDCNDANHLRIDPVLRLALGKGEEHAAGQSMLSRFENEVLATKEGAEALDEVFLRSIHPLIKKKGRNRLVLDLDSTDDAAHGTQEGAAYNGYFKKTCFHPLFCFTSDGDCLGMKLREGNVHSADSTIEVLSPIVDRYRDRFKRFWVRADAAFAKPDLYEYFETNRISYFIRLPTNDRLKKLIWPHLTRPVGRPPKSGIQTKLLSFQYQADSWSKARRVVCKIEWHEGELFPRVGFIATNSRLSAGKIVKVYNGRAEIENRIKEGKLTLRWDKTSCQKFAANEARMKLGVIAYNLLHILRKFYIRGEGVRRSIEWIIRRLIKVASTVAYHARYWNIHISSAFPLQQHYGAVLDSC